MNRLFFRAAALFVSIGLAAGACTSSSVINEAEPPEVTPDPASAEPAEPTPAEPAPETTAQPSDPGKLDPGTMKLGAGAGLKPVAGAKAAKDGDACDKADDCSSGVCEGEGCGAMQGKCVSKDRQCTMDLRQYCGCDGKTFQGGGNCPKGRYSKKGACAGDPIGPVIKKP